MNVKGVGAVKQIGVIICMVIIMFGWILPIERVHAIDFNDVPQNHSLITEMNYLVDRDIIKGYPDGSFKPNVTVTREQVAVLLSRALRLDTTTIKNPNYQDVPVNHPYYKEIAAAHNAGIFQSAQNFTPRGTVTRGTMAIILQRAFHLEGSEANYFTDVTERTDGYQAIYAVANNRIARGYQDGTFKPKLALTRAHFSAFLARALTITKPDMMKDPKYMYTYAFTSPEDNQSYLLNYKYSRNDGKNDVWTITNTTNNEQFNDELLYNGGYVYGQAIAQDYSTHYDLFIELPLRVGIIKHEKDEGIRSGVRITVKDINATQQAGEETYRNVAVLEVTNIFNSDVMTYYYADNVGLIKQMKNGEITYELLKRTAN